MTIQNLSFYHQICLFFPQKGNMVWEIRFFRETILFVEIMVWKKDFLPKNPNTNPSLAGAAHESPS